LIARAASVSVSGDRLSVNLVNGVILQVPLEWYPRLLHGRPEERSEYELIAGGAGIHWSKLDEDIRVQSLFEGKRSQETETSINRWLKNRNHTPA
jgi:hypothetical protein